MKMEELEKNILKKRETIKTEYENLKKMSESFSLISKNIKKETKKWFNELIDIKEKKYNIEIKDMNLKSNILTFNALFIRKSLNVEKLECLKFLEKELCTFEFEVMLDTKLNSVKFVPEENFLFDNEAALPVEFLILMKKLMLENETSNIPKEILTNINKNLELLNSEEKLKFNLAKDIEETRKTIIKYNKSYLNEILLKKGSIFETDIDFEVFGTEVIHEGNEKFMNEENMKEMSERKLEIIEINETGEIKCRLITDETEERIFLSHRVLLADYYIRNLIYFEEDNNQYSTPIEWLTIM